MIFIICTLENSVYLVFSYYNSTIISYFCFSTCIPLKPRILANINFSLFYQAISGIN